MKNLFLLALVFILNCNRGPAEDREQKACKEAKLQSYLYFNINNTSINNEDIVFLLGNITTFCNGDKEEIYSRYYRGYVLDKE